MANISKITDNLFQLILFDNTWCTELGKLATLAQPEDWKGKTSIHDTRKGDHPILQTYLRYTYNRLAYLHNKQDGGKLWIYMDADHMVFDTGLYTPEFNRIFAKLKKIKAHTRKREWAIESFCDEYHVGRIPVLPERSYYFTNTSQLVFDTNKQLRFNAAHVIRDETNRSRIPGEILKLGDAALINALDGAKTLAMKRVLMNYKTAVPQYYNHRIQFLLPLALLDFKNPELALAVNIEGGYYEGRTCLTMSMAYSNARLIARPDSEWLKP